MEKIINIICHPKYIVLYFKDQFYKIIITILSFFIVAASLVAIYDYNTKYYSDAYVDSITNMVINHSEEMDLVFADNKFQGSEYTIKSEEVCLIFMKDAVPSNAFGVLLIFNEDKVTYYYQAMLKYEVSYADLGISSFTFADVQANSNVAKLKLSLLIDNVLIKANKTAQTFMLLSDLINLTMYYAASILLALIVSRFVNPGIELKYRIRICLYDSIVFFIVVVFAFLFGISWLKYVALVMPAIYSVMSFKSIVRIR
jgi:hypothetical protein